MADLPIEEKKEVPLTIEQRMERAEKDIHEVARGVNVQGALLETIVVACDAIIQKYLILTQKHVEPKVVTPEKREEKNAGN